MSELETSDEICRRLQANWDRYRGRYADVLMQAISCTTSGEAFYWSGIERDLVVYALAAINQQTQDVSK